MTTSSRIKSGSSVFRSSSACSPEVAVTTSYPRGMRTASSRRTFSGMSSTTRIVPAPLLLISVPLAVALDRSDELHHVDRLRDVAVEAGLEKTLAIALHRLGRQRDDGDRGCPLVATQAPERCHPVDPR